MKKNTKNSKKLSKQTESCSESHEMKRTTREDFSLPTRGHLNCKMASQYARLVLVGVLALAASRTQTAAANNSINKTHHQQQIDQQSAKQLAMVEPLPVAKAEALTAGSKLFEVCKLQSRVNQQLTNLSQVMFQPSDICSTWSKMLKTPSAAGASSSSGQQQQQDELASSYPWFYVEQLNLAQNNLTVLHEYDGFDKLTNLIDLKITFNQLVRCEENSLVGLNKLQHLDLSHNKLMALPAKFFQPVKLTLKKLNLSYNSMSVLAPSLLNDLTKLEYLDLSHNEITSHWIGDQLFKNLTQLHYLDLSFNKLTVFSSTMTFSSLLKLETLSLQHNELKQVPETIQYLRYLSSLDLSQNQIHDITNASYLSNCRLLFNLNLESNSLENITRDAFSDLPALKVLNLANNKISYLDQQAFEAVPDLHALRLDSNKLNEFGNAFVNLRFLLMLNISSNRISSFDYAQIPVGLQWLDIHSNKIDKLNNFYYTPLAQSQFNSANDINQQAAGSIGQQWQSYSKLTTLDASFNLIKELDNTSLPESLETVQLNNNHIRVIASHTFSTKSNLTRINLSHNQLSTMPFDALKLHGYRDAAPQQQSVSTSIITNGQKFVDIYLANNPFVCNCNMGWFSQLLLASSTLMQGNNNQGANAILREHHLILTRQLPRIVDSHSISCQIAFARHSPALMLASSESQHQWSPIMAANQLALQYNSQQHHSHSLSRDAPLITKQSELLASVHLCPYTSHCFALCYCCDFDACDCEMICPINCTCYYDHSWNTNIVDCSANNQMNINKLYQQSPSKGMHQQIGSIPQRVKFTTIPDKIPMDVTELYLDGLELLHLRGNALIGRKNLKSLYLNNSQIYEIEPRAFATQKSLKILQLNSNQLTELHGHEFEQQVELRELYLAHNQLKSIVNMTFAPLRSLQILHLQNNQLYHVNFWSNLPTGHKLSSLNLGYNPWSCQCDYVEPMLQWLQLNLRHLDDRKSISCQYNRTNSLHLIAPSVSTIMKIASSDDQDGYSAFDSLNENYPMFEMRLCLNHTVLVRAPEVLAGNSFKYPSFPGDKQIPSDMQPQEDYLTNNTNLQPSNDQPSFPSNPRNPYPGLSPPDLESIPQFTYQPQLPSPGRVNVFSPSYLLTVTSISIISLLLVLSLIYYRRSMGVWFYSHYGLNMFAATKSHNHNIGSMSKHSQLHHHHPHLHHHLQYGPSSAGSTSSSSAASSNLSQALCQQQQAANASSGLVTTPLIVTNNHQLLNSATTTTTSPYNDDEKLFDAYVTYSKLDEQFINDCIAPELEYGQPSYRVALHYRDLPVTTSEFLTDCIIETANASRRIIMILSEQMLKTEWMRYEFRSAHLEALKNNYRHRLIVIMLGQPSLATLDSDILQWLKTCTCIQWGDKMFWQRLRFAMPELPSNRQPQYLRYQTLAQANAAQQQQAKQKNTSLGVNFLKSAGGFLSGNHHNSNNNQHLHQPAQMQQLITSNSMSLSRPLPSIMQHPSSSPEEHHYAHLSPATMIYNQQQANTYHQPIYGDPQQQHQQQQQQQQQQACNGRDNNPTVPVHI